MTKYKYAIIKNSANCPDRLNKDGVFDKDKYYRMVDTLPLQKLDFVPHYFLPKHQEMIDAKRKKKKLSISDICRYCSVSVFQNLDDFVEMTETNVRLKKKYIFEGHICGTKDGVILKTPSKNHPSHYDWFPYSGVMETFLFKKVIYENGRIVNY